MIKKYGGHAATLLVYFKFSNFGVPEPRIELGAALQQHDVLPVGYVATLWATSPPYVGYVEFKFLTLDTFFGFM